MVTWNWRKPKLVSIHMTWTIVKRFPYGILYSEEESGIYIIAVMHLHRFPDYWKHRK